MITRRKFYYVIKIIEVHYDAALCYSQVMPHHWTGFRVKKRIFLGEFGAFASWGTPSTKHVFVRKHENVPFQEKNNFKVLFVLLMKIIELANIRIKNFLPKMVKTRKNNWNIFSQERVLYDSIAWLRNSHKGWTPYSRKPEIKCTICDDIARINIQIKALLIAQCFNAQKFEVFLDS